METDFRDQHEFSDFQHQQNGPNDRKRAMLNWQHWVLRIERRHLQRWIFSLIFSKTDFFYYGYKDRNH